MQNSTENHAGIVKIFLILIYFLNILLIKSDQHFSILTKFYNKKAAKRSIYSTDDLIDCYISSQNEINQQREKNKLDPIILYALKLEQDNRKRTIQRSTFEIDHITCYYNLENSLNNSSQNNKPVIKSTILTGYPNKFIVDLEYSKICSTSEAISSQPENFFQPGEYDLGYLERKINFIKRKY